MEQNLSIPTHNNSIRKITPFLWFDQQAEEAMQFYCSIFKNSHVLSLSRGHDGKVSTVSFELEGQQFIGLNGGPTVKFNGAISFSIDCKDQAEVDELWNKLTADGGQGGCCGWLTDKYGVSWQVIPSVLEKFITDPDPEKSKRVWQAMMNMKRIIIDDLDKAYHNNNH